MIIHKNSKQRSLYDNVPFIFRDQQHAYWCKKKKSIAIVPNQKVTKWFFLSLDGLVQNCVHDVGTADQPKLGK